MEKYIKCKQNELRDCAENYMKMVNDPTGNAFTNIADELLFIFSLKDYQQNDKFLLIHCLADSYKSNKKEI
jgi:uncharacterized membrane protein YcgQ (UPF0703/DUF1980 family)